MFGTFASIEERQRAGQTVSGIPSGFNELDELTAGFQPGDLIVVASRPVMGKTSFATNVAQHVAIAHRIPVMIFTLGETKEGLVQRMIATEARVDSQRLRKGTIREEDMSRLARAAGILSGAPIWINENQDRHVSTLVATARTAVAKHGVRLVIVDYLQLLEDPTARAENRHQEVAAISRVLKALARELRVPVMVLSQCSRAPDQRAGDHRPLLNDLRDSGAIEDDADVILFVYRQEVYDGPVDKDGISIEGRAEIIVGKQRNGPIGCVNLFFQKGYTRFENYARVR